MRLAASSDPEIQLWIKWKKNRDSERNKAEDYLSTEDIRHDGYIKILQDAMGLEQAAEFLSGCTDNSPPPTDGSAASRIGRLFEELKFSVSGTDVDTSQYRLPFGSPNVRLGCVLDLPGDTAGVLDDGPDNRPDDKNLSDMPSQTLPWAWILSDSTRLTHLSGASMHEIT